MSSVCPRRGLVRYCGTPCSLLLLGVISLTAGGAERVLRIAADPNNLPFSNERREGFENRIAEIIGEELGARIEYMWWPQRRGFFRETLGSGRADLVMGVPEGFERVLTTQPYYTSSYFFVGRADGLPVSSFDDPALRGLTIGVQLAGDDGTNTPPAHALAQRGLVKNIRGYTLYGDYAQDSPPSRIIEAVAEGEVDVAVAWGPMAGFFAKRQRVPLRLLAVEPCDCPPLRFVFPISIGVARNDPALRTEIDAVLVRRSAEIRRILDDYAVPRVEFTNARKEVRHATTRTN
ncbi:MAG: quinoprotein dehydrogenase-associated putative ABC transporter substrate-binding protein [Opitutus sp.]|nr:quinoprotein dehydrogenase-associated putative ABC transporter substrate-binding protein [Opitutus sp.]